MSCFVSYFVTIFVIILVLLKVTVITDGRERKFVVMSSLVSLVISFLKELISAMVVLKTVRRKSSLLSFLNNTVAYQCILVDATFCFR